MNDLHTLESSTREYWEPPGSTFYYSVLFLPPTPKKQLNLLAALRNALYAIPIACQEPAVAVQKLEWWRGELHRYSEGQATHPLTRALDESLQGKRLPPSLLAQWIQGVSLDLQYQGYATFDDFRLYCHCKHATLEQLILHVLGMHQPQVVQPVEQLSVALGVLECIALLGRHLRRDRIYLPEEWLQQHQLDASQLLSMAEPSESLRRLLFDRTQWIHSVFQNMMDEKSLWAQLPTYFFIKINIQQQLLKEVERTQFATLNQSVDLTAVRKLWIAWRSRRRHRRWISA